MSILDDFYNSQTSSHVVPTNHVDTGQVTIAANILPDYQDKCKRIIQTKGYYSTQDYINSLFKELPDLIDTNMPYEIYKMIDEDYKQVLG